MRSQWVWHRKASWNAPPNQYFHDPAKTRVDALGFSSTFEDKNKSHHACKLFFYGATGDFLVDF
jgi:hypothetical protein